MLLTDRERFRNSRAQTYLLHSQPQRPLFSECDITVPHDTHSQSACDTRTPTAVVTLLHQHSMVDFIST